MKVKNIVFWQQEPSLHQAPYIKKIDSQCKDLQVYAVFQRPLRQERVNQGWGNACFGGANIIIGPSEEEIYELIFTLQNVVHIFSGIVSNKNIRKLFEKCLKTNAIVGLLSEGRDWRGSKGKLRLAHSYLIERKYRNKLDFVLTLGTMAEEWFLKCGYSIKKLYKFCYVVDAPKISNKISNDGLQTELCILFIGQLVERKRVDLLIESLAKIRDKKWKLEIIGDGKIRKQLEDLVKERELEGKISFLGVINNRDLSVYFDRSDLLVLPSAWDGWGAVINEAVQSGVPVVCSDFCGAAGVVEASGAGGVFKNGSVEMLTNNLNRQIQNGKYSASERKKLQLWSSCISDKKIARYFVSIVEYIAGYQKVKPIAPWEIEK